MSVRIHLSDDIVLKSDNANWILAETRVYGSGKNVGEVYDVDVGFFGSFQSALRAALDRHMRSSDAASFAELKDALDDFSARLAEVLQPKVSISLSDLLKPHGRLGGHSDTS